MMVEQDTASGELRGHWERVAEQWIRWARLPGHDAFWSYREEFRRFVPLPGVATLEVGCGEGRIARELTRLGHTVTAVDRSETLVRAARAAASAARYVRADASQLPFVDNSFDRVVAYNMLMDVDDMLAVITEAARVLCPGGVLTVSVVHPLTDRGDFVDSTPDAGFVVQGSYYERRRVRATEARNGLSMDFASWSYPLGDYVAALREAGLAVTHLAEPRPADTAASRAGRWDRIPLFCWLNAQHLRNQ